MIIQTKRLRLIPMSAAFMRASLDYQNDKASELLGAHLPADWPDCCEVLVLRLKQLEQDPSLSPWLLRALVLHQKNTMAGYIGFHTGPNPPYLTENGPGGIEFGFTVFESFRRQGLAREASQALMQWAFQSHHVTRFILSIRPDNLPSQQLAAQLGFRRIGSHMDEIDGVEDVLEKTLE